MSKAMQNKILDWATAKGYTSVGSLGGPREAPYAGQDITPRGEKYLFVKFGKPSLFEATVRIFHSSVIEVRYWQPNKLCRWVHWHFAPPKEPVKEMKNAKVPRSQRQSIPWDSLVQTLDELETRCEQL